MLGTGQGRELPVVRVPDLCLGPAAGVSEVPVRIAHHPLGTVIAVLDRDVGRHTLRLRRARCAPQGAASFGAERVGEQPGQQPQQRHVELPDAALV